MIQTNINKNIHTYINYITIDFILLASRYQKTIGTCPWSLNESLTVQTIKRFIIMYFNFSLNYINNNFNFRLKKIFKFVWELKIKNTFSVKGTVVFANDIQEPCGPPDCLCNHNMFCPSEENIGFLTDVCFSGRATKKIFQVLLHCEF